MLSGLNIWNNFFMWSIQEGKNKCWGQCTIKKTQPLFKIRSSNLGFDHMGELYE